MDTALPLEHLKRANEPQLNKKLITDRKIKIDSASSIDAAVFDFDDFRPADMSVIQCKIVEL